MKKILAALLVLALVAPAMAVNFSLTPGAAGTGKLTVNYALTSPEALRGMAVKISVLSGDAKIANNTKVTMGTLPGQLKYAFIDYAFTQGGSYTLGSGNPIANPTAAGTTVTYPASVFSVSFGILDDGSTQAGLTVSSFFDVFFTLTTQSVVKVEVDTLRGGIVGDNITTNNLPLQATLDPAPQECVKTTAPFYNDWVTFGRPNCWCFQRQCRGDINGTGVGTSPAKKWITTTDLTLFKAAYNLANSVLPAGGICADLNHAGVPSTYGASQKRVTTTDLTTFKLYYNKAENDPVNPVTVCPMDNYNFWTN